MPSHSELGPIMPEDGLLLQAIIRMTNPKTLVEFGHFWGASARIMLEAMDEDAVLHSYDNTKDSSIEGDPRFIFHRQSQEEVSGIESIDFVFLDASHDFDLNVKTFEAIMHKLSPKAIIAVHDTGTWIGGNVYNAEAGYANDRGDWVHCPDELKFVDWIADTYPEFQQMHFHSSRALRHGITLLQRYEKLT